MEGEKARVIPFLVEATPAVDILADGTVIDETARIKALPGARATEKESASIGELMKPLRPYLDDPRVTELVINQPGQIIVEAGPNWVMKACPSMDLPHCLSLATAIATGTSQLINETRPLLSATLPGTEERVQIVIPPSVEDGFVSFTFRKPSKVVLTLKDFETQGVFGQVDGAAPVGHSEWTKTLPISSCGVKLLVDKPEEVREKLDVLEPFEVELLRLLWEGRISEFMRSAVRYRRNMAISGATGSGKTTFMKGIMQECPRHERLITIEDAREIFLPNHPNKVHLLYSKGAQGVANVTASTLLASCLRMKPDRILLAEIRSGECFDFIKLAASGHPGSITSLHSESCLEAFEQMALMCRQSEDGAGLSHSEIIRLLRLRLDVLVQFHKLGRHRRVTEIYYRPLLKRSLQV